MKKTLFGLILAMAVVTGSVMAGGDGCCGACKAGDTVKDQTSCPAKTDTTKTTMKAGAGATTAKIAKPSKDAKAPAKDTTLVKK